MKKTTYDFEKKYEVQDDLLNEGALEGLDERTLHETIKAMLINTVKDCIKYETWMDPDMAEIGGHSKGGNLAVYASIFADSEVKKRIINVYNNDGPGFNEDIINTEEYKKSIEKVITYIPQDSIFGMLLNHEEKYTVVQSTQKGVMEHDVYSW